ncbi:Aste57867_14342 [Aphanomyces stellatus]|uniref:Aste57867_14342 protein n=1 Tax=Aphanomyces stellatus TaxID=120398 RepID=A0A485L0Q5_9STRA|nr:hypothetical protein As57867_014288 [Aphanomyces stellatus]VFT91166.1 Aste57867_14342 [Aphanomyces stellatus]
MSVVERARLVLQDDPRAVVLLILVAVMSTWLLFRRFTKTSSSRVLLSDLARVECLSTDRFMHKIVLPAREPATHRKLVVVIPGNPGVPGFYEPFMRHLQHLSDYDMEVVGLSHTGHSLPWINKDETFDFETQIIDKLAYVQKRVEQDSKLKLILIGHSMGSHIALRLLKHFPDHVEKLVLLTPTIMRIADTPRAHTLMPFLSRYDRVADAVRYVERLPSFVKKALVAWFVPPREFHKATLGMVDSAVARNCFKTAWHEMHDIKELDHELVDKHQEKILFVFAETDGWCPRDQMDELIQRYTRAKHLVVLLSHAFMMDPNGSQVMATHAHEWIYDDDARRHCVPSSAASSRMPKAG